MNRPLSLLMIMALGLCLCSMSSAECPNGVCGVPGGSGFYGGWSAPVVRRVAQPRIIYRSIDSTPSIAQSSFSSGYSRDGEGNLIAPDGARVTAINGTPIGPAKTASAATSKDGQAICNCDGCDCGEHIQQLEERIDRLERNQPALDKPAVTADPKLPGWQRALAERGRPREAAVPPPLVAKR